MVNWLTTTDHKTIGFLYLITSFVMFCFGGLEALIIRTELFEPGLQIVQTKEQYNQLFTGHGTIMMLLFATPLFAGVANVMTPLQVGAPDVAFPRLNALARGPAGPGILPMLSGAAAAPRNPARHWTR